MLQNEQRRAFCLISSFSFNTVKSRCEIHSNLLFYTQKAVFTEE